MARRRPPTVHGWRSSTSRPGSPATTSSAMLRRRFGERRVGHAGTLDPDATGVLVVGVGKVTRLLRFLTGLGKRYTRRGRARHETTTLDAAGEVTGTFDMPTVTLDAGRAAVAEHLDRARSCRCRRWSARCKVDGRRLHELAREGIEVEREPRPVTVHRFDRRRHRRPAGARDRRRLLVGHLHPHARRRPRRAARRRRPPARPAAHRASAASPSPRRSRRSDAAAARPRRRRCATTGVDRRRRRRRRRASRHGRLLDARRRRRRPGRGPCSTPAASCSPSTRPTAAAAHARSSCSP